MTGNGTATLALTGTIGSLNGDLATLTYTPNAGYHGSDTLTLSNAQSGTSIDLGVGSEIAAYFEEVASAGGDARAAANWVLNEFSAHLNEARLTAAESPVRPPALDMVKEAAPSW